MNKAMRTKMTAVLVLAACLLPLSARPADHREETRKLISVLQTESPLYDKARACQRLGEIGDGTAVAVLASLLGDPKLGAFARSGLENIPAPSAAAALRAAAARLKGPALVGVVQSLGAIRDEQAVELLSGFVSDPGSGVSGPALLALGNIGTSEAVKVLRSVLAKGPEGLRPNAAAGCLLAADRLRFAGDLRGAATLYESVLKANVAAGFHMAATRGAILSRKGNRAAFLVRQLRSPNLTTRNAALGVIREIPDDKLAAALNRELKQAPLELEGQLLLALSDCHNADSISLVATFTQSANADIRRTARLVLGRLGPAAAAPLLASLATARSNEERSAAVNGLRSLEGAEVDDQIQRSMVSANDPAIRIDLIRLLNSRGATKATAAILDQAAGANPEVSIAALSALKVMADPQMLPRLMGLVASATNSAVREAAEGAVAGVCSRSGEGAPAADAVLQELGKAGSTAATNSCVRILTLAGYAKALPFIEAAARSPNAEVAANALTQLGRWPDPAPAETLVGVVEASSAPPLLRQKALASLLELSAAAADDAQRPDATIAGWLGRVAPMAVSTPDRKRLLGILGRLKTIESFQLLSASLDTPEFRAEAASGLVAIAPALAKGDHASELKPVLEKIAAANDLGNLSDRARQVLKTIPNLSTGAPIFDGKSLSGWEGNTNVWRVRDGVIVGGSMNGNPQNEFLATTRSYTNFSLRLEYKLAGTEGFINGGVQFRSVRIANPPNEMRGYQADIGANFSGCLYDESRRNTVLARAGEDLVKKIEKPGDWNSYEVRARGPRIQIWLNGQHTVDYTEADATIPLDGVIALQIHGGSKAEISFRNLTLAEP
jgi:HEAT repeat protein